MLLRQSPFLFCAFCLPLFRTPYATAYSHDHMNHIWNQDYRDGQVSDDAVRPLNEGQQSELGDAEVHDAADEGGDDFLAGNTRAGLSCVVFVGESFILRLWRGCFLFITADSFHHGGDHVYRRGDSAQDDEDGDERRHKGSAHAVLYHEEGRHVLGGCFRVGVDGHQTENDHDHHQGVDHEADAHALYGVAWLFKGLGVLDEDRDVGKLEGSVNKRGIKGGGQRQFLSGHGAHGVGNLRQAGDDIWNVYNQQAGDDADGKNRRDFPHQVGAENGHHKDEDADDEGTQQIRQSCQSAQCRAAGGEGNGGSHTHDADIEHFKEV